MCFWDLGVRELAGIIYVWQKIIIYVGISKPAPLFVDTCKKKFMLHKKSSMTR